MPKSLKEYISNKNRNKIVQFISTHRKNFFISSILKLAEYITYAGKNVSYNSMTNGENLVFKILSKYNFNTIIDCGANTGTNTKMYKIFNPNATIYAIEAIDETLEKCKELTKEYKNIFYYNIGLGSKKQNVAFKYFPKNVYLSTKYENVTGRTIDYTEKNVTIDTGDNFCEKNNIEHINFLKIDVEGMDFEVIKGFKQMIENKKIDALQIEYCANFIHSKHLLKDVYDFFAPYNYSIGKIYPTGVDFVDYNIKMEDYTDANYLIIRSDLKEIIDDLREKPRK